MAITALMCASSTGHLDVVRALLAANADVNATNAHGNTALMYASKGWNHSHLEVVQALLAAKADVNAKDADGDTALIYASREWPPGGGADLARRKRRCERQGCRWRHGVDVCLAKWRPGGGAGPDRR